MNRLEEAVAIIRSKWPVESAQAGGHLERDVSAIMFGQSITPRTAAQRWHRWLTAPVTSTAPATVEAMVAAIVEPAPAVESKPYAPAAPRKLARAARIVEGERQAIEAIRNVPRASAYTYTAPRQPVQGAELIPAKLAALKPYRAPRARKPDPAAWEAAGELALTSEPDAPSEGKGWHPPMALPRMVIVRSYYRSMGGEMLAFDSEPMLPAAARRLRDQVEGSASSPNIVPDTHAELIQLDETNHRPMYGARLVVLPSQMREAAETSRVGTLMAA